MKIGYYDNAARRVKFQDILRDYDPSGYSVSVTYPIQFTGTIIKQMRHGYTASPAEFFLVKMDHPVTFDWYSSQVLRNDIEKMTVVYEQLKNFGCLSWDDPSDQHPHNATINCLFVQWSHMRAIEVRRGQPLEYQETASHSGISGTKTTLGIAQNVFKNPKNDHIIVEFFLLEPLTWMRAPLAIETDHLKPEHVSRFSVALTVDGVYRDWKEKYPLSLPPGTFTEDREEFILQSPIELSEVKPICDSLTNAEDKTRCLLEASLFHVLPIDVNHSSGVFRPMRMEHAGYVIPYTVTKQDLEKWFGEHRTDL